MSDNEVADGTMSPDEMPDDKMSPDRMSPDRMSEQIDDLDARIARLGAYIDARHDVCAVSDLCRLLDLHSTMLSRVTRMRQVRNALNGAQTRMMILLYEVLDDFLDEQEGRRGQDSASPTWVQGTLPGIPKAIQKPGLPATKRCRQKPGSREDRELSP